MRRWPVLLTLLFTVACSTASPATSNRSSPSPTLSSGSTATKQTPSLLAVTPPTGAQVTGGGCGQTPVYTGGQLPDWATVNAPHLPYVVGTPGTVVGYLFTPRLAAGDGASNKILWYVATPRDGKPLVADGHPVGTSEPTAHFEKEANSFPGEIYPSGPTVPNAGCWRFSLTWLGGAQ